MFRKIDETLLKSLSVENVYLKKNIYLKGRKSSENSITKLDNLIRHFKWFNLIQLTVESFNMIVY